MSDPFQGIEIEPENNEVQPKKKKSKKVSKTEKRIVNEQVRKKEIVKLDKSEAKQPTLKERATLIYAIKAYGKSPRFKKYLKSQGKSSAFCLL